jgi:phosphoribosyl-AMP cyclohydrolase
VATDSSAKPADDLEEGVVLRPRFDAAGLITCVTTDAATGEVLMVAYMNAEALQKTVESGEAWYFSRSRKALWHKGETSGHVQRVIEIRTDCDQDAIWLRVDQTGGAACHTGRRSCFYRAVVPGEQGGAALKFVDADRLFDPDAVYGKAGHGHSHD